MTGNRLSAFVAFSCLAMGHLLFAPIAASQELRPNIRALPPTNISIVPNADTGNPEIRFAASSWNSGVGPLELVAGETGPAGQNVYQRVYKAGGGSTDYLAGTFVWHPQHNHFHFQEYALYTLTPINAPGKSKREAYKTSFCVMDTNKIDGSLAGAPKRAVYATCANQIQGMSIGWSDTYGATLAGQSIDLTGYDDGLYELSLKFDPSNRLLETNDDDNSACLLLQLNIAARTVQSRGACGASGSSVTIWSLTPPGAGVGAIVEAEITGTNFFPGIAVGFENGSGATPIVSNVTVQDTTRITLTIYVKSGGNKNIDPLWDLRVGSAVLPNAFTVVK